MTDKFIFDYIELKEQENFEFIRYSYYELKIKSNLTDEEIDRFLKVNRDYLKIIIIKYILLEQDMSIKVLFKMSKLMS